MQMKDRIAVLALAIGFLAAPGLRAVAMDSCPPCCRQPGDCPCETGEAPCETLSTLSCCDVAPAAPAFQAKRSIDAPVPQPVALAVPFGVPTPKRTPSSRARRDLVALSSPLRLSVVLLI